VFHEISPYLRRKVSWVLKARFYVLKTAHREGFKPYEVRGVLKKLKAPAVRCELISRAERCIRREKMPKKIHLKPSSNK